MFSVGKQQRRGAVAVGAGCAIFALLAQGCGRKDASTTALATGTLAGPAVSVAPAADAAAKLRAIAVSCQINVENSTIGACKNDERQALVREINAGTVDRASALEALVAELESGDKTRQTVAAKVLEGAFRTSLGKLARAGSLSSELSARLLTAALKLDRRQAQQAVPAAVHVAVVTGQGELLMRTLEAHPDDEVRVAAYPHVLRYGGRALLEPIERLVAAPNPKVAAAAFEAIRRMPEPTEAEQQRLCDVGKANAKDPRDPVAAKALSILATCKGAYADGALAEVQRRASTNKLSGDVVRSLDPLCTAAKSERTGTASQCVRVRALLERVLNNKRQSEEVRAAALLSLGVQFPDARTRALAERMAQDPAPRVSKTAARVTAGIAQLK